jgi:hypothetical protein
MTLLTYCNEENRTNRVNSLLLVRNSFDPIQTPHGKRSDKRVENIASVIQIQLTTSSLVFLVIFVA